MSYVSFINRNNELTITPNFPHSGLKLITHNS